MSSGSRFLPSSVSFSNGLGGHLPLPFDHPSNGVQTHVVHLEIVGVCVCCGRLEPGVLICPNAQHVPIALGPPSLSAPLSQPHGHHSFQQTTPANPTTSLTHWQAAGPATDPSFSPCPPISYATQITTNSLPTIPQISSARSAPANSDGIPATGPNMSELPYVHRRYPEAHEYLQQPPHQQAYQYHPAVHSGAYTIQGPRVPPEAVEGAQLVNLGTPLHNAYEHENAYAPFQHRH